MYTCEEELLLNRYLLFAVLNKLYTDSSSVWDPYQVGQINAIEMVQRKAARFCLNRYQKMDSVSAMIQELNWNSLAERRKASRLSSFCKVFNNEESLHDLNSHITRAPLEMLRHGHNFRVQSINCRKNIGHYSFLPRSIRDWNSLPPGFMNEEVIEDPSHFRSLLIDHQ